MHGNITMKFYNNNNNNMIVNWNVAVRYTDGEDNKS